ncbi:MAG: mercuric transporter MerT family protein [Bdellovibrionales bacterium]
MKTKQIENKSSWLIGGGILASITASLCCVGPLILTVVGISGGAALAKLDVLRIPMIILVAAIFGFAGFTLYRKRNSCEPGSICADPKKFKKMIVFYWLGLFVALLGITSPQWIVWFFS